MKRQAGFTLIELLLVLAIIGIISAIAIPALLGQRDSAKAKATVATAGAVASEVAAAAKLMNNASTGAVMTYVAITLANFKYPNAKNAYNGTSSPLVKGAAAQNPGQVGMVASTALDINGSSHNVIVVSYMLKTGGAQVLSAVPVE